MDVVHPMRSLTGRDLDRQNGRCLSRASRLGPGGPGVPEAMSRAHHPGALEPDRLHRRGVRERPGPNRRSADRAGADHRRVVSPQPGFLEHIRHPHQTTRCAARVRRGEDGPHHRTRWCHRAARGGAGPGLPSQVARGWPSRRCGGGSASATNEIVSGRYLQLGTFNGNPLSMAAARARAARVLDQEAYLRLERLGEGSKTGLASDPSRNGIFPGSVIAMGARGSLAFRAAPVLQYRDFLQVDLRDHQAGAGSTFSIGG